MQNCSAEKKMPLNQKNDQDQATDLNVYGISDKMQIWMSTQKSGDFTPKMDAENFTENPIKQMDDLGVFPLFLDIFGLTP